MRKTIISFLIIVGILCIVVYGVYYPKYRANKTLKENFFAGEYKVGLWDMEFYPKFAEEMVEELPDSNMIIRAKAIDSEFSPDLILQYVEVQEVFKGDGIEKGDKIAITDEGGWGFFLVKICQLNCILLT